MAFLLLAVSATIKATDYVSTITGVNDDGTGISTLTTTEGNNWNVVSAGEVTYASGANFARINAANSANGLRLTSAFTISGRITSIVINGGMELSEGEFEVKAGSDEMYPVGSGNILQDNSQYEADFNMEYESVVFSDASVSIVFYPNSADDVLDISSITITTVTDYGILLYNGVTPEVDAIEVSVTDENCTDVFGDGGSVTYDPSSSVLTLTNATIGSDNIALMCQNAQLTINLVGNNVMKATESFINIYNDDEEPELIFTTSADNPGSLTFKNWWDDDPYVIDEYALYPQESATLENGLVLLPNGTDYVMGVFAVFGIKVNNIPVSSLNRDNVLYDEAKTVRFDSINNKLILKNANIVSTDDTAPITSENDILTIELQGTNYIYGNPDYPVIMGGTFETAGSLTFTTEERNPGKLLWPTGAQLASSYEVTCENGLVQNDNGHYIAADNPYDYRIAVSGVAVTSFNAADVLGDRTVSYDEETNTLTLNNAEIYGDVLLYMDVESLNIMLKGANTITGKLLAEQKTTTADVTFDINPNNPGSLTFIGKTTAADISEGVSITLNNGLLQAAVNEGADWEISTFQVITPIVNEDETDVYVQIYYGDFYENYYTPKDLSNTVINDVLYTLPATGSGEEYQGYSSSEYPSGVIIATGLTDAEVEDAVSNYEVGTAEFASAFHGITLMVPAGEGEVTFGMKSFNGGVVKVKVGDGAAFTPTGQSSDSYTDITIPYSCTEPTYIFIYLQEEPDASASRGNAPHREKVQHATVKVTNYTGSASMSISGGSASVYKNASSYGRSASGSFSMDNVSMAGAASSRSNGKMNEGSVKVFPIVSVGPYAFSDFAGKEELRYIDLSGTRIKGATVNRKIGTFSGFSPSTVIYLPNDNDDGEEGNVVIDGQCRELQLDDAKPFLVPTKSFGAMKATLKRDFTVGKTSTVFLPFKIPAHKAAELGTFHQFKEINGADAVFHEAETGDIAANTPYIFVPAETSISVSNVTVVGIGASTASSGSLVGTYEAITWSADQDDVYGFAATDLGDVAQGQFVRVGAGAWLPPFRAYLQVSSAAPARLRLVIDGQATAITAVDTDTTQADEWYTLGGQRLSGKPAVKGMYINNGKKTIVR